MSSPAELSVVVPLKWEEDGEAEDLTAYLRFLAGVVHEVIVVDGSPKALFDGHAELWRGTGVRHIPPDRAAACANGKVAGIRTGVTAATREKVVIADDDVRYDEPSLGHVSRLLDGAHLVRPQNYFDPAPWHAVWDTGRTLLNRSVGQDYPGTFGLRRSALLGIGGYDGNTLFENLELVRTVRAAGGTEVLATGLYVRRLPPRASRFWSQRPRQAYDDTAQPARMALFLSLLPLTGVAALRSPGLVAAGAGAVVLLAEAGRRRAGGRDVFPLRASLGAPFWVLERAVCAWPSFAAWLTGRGVPYAGSRLTTAAHSPRLLRRSRAGTLSLRPAGGGEPDLLVRAVAEGAYG
jgi:hypothetical protein